MEFLACDDVMQLFEEDNFVAIVAITFGCLIGMVGIVAGTMGAVLKTRAKELTRRELAAYVAEGSIQPGEAVAMLNAGRPKWEQGDLRA